MSKKQEQALCLRHQDFGGLSSKEAAKQMGISQSALNGLLARLKKNPCFQAYFPIITKHEAKIYHFYMIEGWEVSEIAEYTELTPNAIYKTLQRARDKGMYFTKAKDRMLTYTPDRDDNQIKHKF